MLSHTINHSFKPDKSYQYFSKPSLETDKIVAVILPFFNEEDTDMKRTLISLKRQEEQCDGFTFKYLAIMDGWEKASDSMKNYMYDIFPGCWPEQIENSKNEIETHILEYPDKKIDIGNEIEMNFSLLIKKDNRKKANSHEWFFNAFAKDINADYTFATDCGTLFHENCLISLLEYIERHEEISAVTGRQRVMSQEQQGITYESYKGMWYRAGQAFDYEASISSFQGSFSLFGMLPVLPGPCGLYRYSDIKGECLDYYFDVVNNNGPESGLIMGNLLLAEDRILSFAAALKTGKFTKWVPGATFYFEAETKTSNFITQRRRWTNGAFAGYIYLIFMNPGIIWNSKHSFFFKFMNYLLLSFQFLSFLFTGLSPGIFMALGARSVKELEILPENINKYTSYVISGIYLTLWLSFIFLHYRNKFVSWIYNTVMYFNVFIYLFVMASFVKIIFLGDIVIISLLIVSLFVPFILAIFHSIDVFVMMVVNFIPFLLFLPTFIPWFVTYAYSRTWDLTWGNRPSQLMDDVKNDKNKVERKLKIKGLIIIGVLLFVNIGMLFVLNFFEYGFLVFLSSSFLILALIQQCLSFIYFIFKTDHLLLSCFNKLDKMYIKLIGLILLCASFSLITTSIFTPYWLTNTNKSFNGTDTVDLYYGILYIKMVYPENTFKSETVAWGTNILYEWPNTIWAITLLMAFLVFVFMIISMLSIFNGFFQRDSSRTKHIMIFYLLSSCILLFVCILLFPFGFNNMSSFKTDWLNIEMCSSAGTYNSGECSIGWSFWTFISGFVILIVAYNTLKFGELKQIREKYVNRKMYKMLPSNNNSLMSEVIIE